MEEPNVSKDLLSRMLFIESDNELTKLLTAHPELHPFAEVALPMHEAINMLISVERSNQSEYATDTVLSIQEYKPGISAVLTEAADGKRVMDLYEVPAEVLSKLIARSPKNIVAYIAPTLQVGLHHPEYLTVECYWLLDQLVSSERTEPATAQKLSLLQGSLGICLERGYDSDWIAGIR